MSTIILAIVVGASFGFILDRVGATNPNYVINMLRLSNLHLMKTILFGIGIASVLTFGGITLGLLDVGHLSVKAAYIGVLIGGGMLGIGFAIAGYCPGTSLAAAATGRKDALFFVLGGLVGAGGYMASYSWIASTGVLGKVLGGKATIGAIAGAKYPALFGWLPGEVTGIILGIIIVAIAIALPSRTAAAQ
jgi:hypothetical protein